MTGIKMMIGDMKTSKEFSKMSVTEECEAMREEANENIVNI